MYYFVLFDRCRNVAAAGNVYVGARGASSRPSCELKKWSANENIEHQVNLTHSQCIKKDRIRFHALEKYFQIRECLLFSVKIYRFCENAQIYRFCLAASISVS